VSANVSHISQQSQFSCCSASLASCFHALGKNFSEEDIQNVLKSSPMSGASWEGILATVQYLGGRGSLVSPATLCMVKNWTDRGTPVLFSWTFPGKSWSHASVIYDVQEGPKGLLVHVMDPNIANPSKTTRIVPEEEFYDLWYEPVGTSMRLRRPAMAIEREVTPDGRQVVASLNMAGTVARRFLDKIESQSTQPLMTRRDYGAVDDQ